MIELLTIFFIIVGTGFLAVGTLGLIKLPNVYNRMHATTKATTLGAASIFLAVFTQYFNGPGLTALVGIVFLFLTAPIGAHLIAKASQTMGVDFEDGVEWPDHSEEQSEETSEKRHGVNALKEFLR